MPENDDRNLWSIEDAWSALIRDVKDYGIFMLDAEGRVVMWNAGAERMFGFLADEILGQPFSVIFTPHDLEKLQPQFEMAEAKEKGRCEDERWHIRKDGSQFWGSGVVTPLWSSDGTLRGFAKVVRDVTERKQAEDALAEANRRKDEFLAMLSHELRNPLAAILTSIELVKGDHLDEAVVRQTIEIVDRQARLLVHMVNDLLDIARIGKGTLQLARERVELQDVVRHAVETVQAALTGHGHYLSVSLPSEPIALDADSSRLEQVFSNLLNNAIKYTDPGGQISLTVARHDQQARISVKDNGAGILAEMLPRIFDLFVQADRSLDRSQGGLGIGLTLVKRLVEIHAGKVEAFSEGVGKGSEFVVTLPVLSESNTATAAGESRDEPTAAKPLCILVVEDNEDTALSQALILRKHGHEVIVAHCGTDALRLAHERRPQVVLLDIGLPGMDGFRVAEHLRNQDGMQNATLIAMTGHGQEEDQRRSMQAGVDYHLVKPVNMVDVLKLVVEAAQ
jgi:PAS domain S-box-containing protein